MVLIMIRFIEITQHHIAEGEPGNPECCAIALALSEEYQTDKTKVDLTGLFVNDKELKIADKQEVDIFDWIQCYDDSYEESDDWVEPFTLKVIEEIYENKSK
ncbi:hypothetical protein [uncultured Mediterranean phage uvMED]|nr:hypothetical protein [uncultured Mediterranean phage uvMED]BAQ87785.1 hypothetical protein [uncultured Mediterranean phage uvMED]